MAIWTGGGRSGIFAEALRSGRNLRSVAMLEAVGGVKGGGIGGGADIEVVTAEPWNSGGDGVVPEFGDEAECLLQVLIELKSGPNIVGGKAGGNGMAIYGL